MTCCEDERSESKAPIKLGKGSLRERVKALGNSPDRARCANPLEWMRSVNWEKTVPRVNPIFCCHAYSHFGQHFQKIVNKISKLQYVLYLKFGGLLADPSTN